MRRGPAIVVSHFVSALALAAGIASAATLPSGFREQSIGGLARPVNLAVAPDGRVFVSQQCGALRVIKNGVLLSTPFATLPVNCNSERGLHGIAFDPEYTTNGYVYVRYTRADPQNNVIGRLRASATNPDVSDGSLDVLFPIPYRGNVFHHGGGLLVGHDGKLYSGIGDHETGTGQSFSNLWGKVIRINLDGSIPADNPFYTTTTGENRAIWAYGFRNPFGMAIQRTTGRIFVNDAGNTASSCCEEINELRRGDNYNWPASMGTGSYFSYTASTQGGSVIVGADFYNPVTVTFPASYVGRYFFADYGGGWIRSVAGSGSPGSLTPFASGISGPVDVEVHPDGSMWYTSILAGAVRRITFEPTPTPCACPTPTPTAFPTPTPTPDPPPLCTIQPGPGLYRAGEQLCYTGSCSDAQDGPLPPSAYHWEVVFHHQTHTHPGYTFDGVTSICFDVPRDGEWDPVQFWRVHLIGRSSGGASSAVSVDARPRTQTLTLDSSPAGLQVSADGVTGPGPHSMDAIAGGRRILDAPAPQMLGGLTYYIAAWSDGGARRHDVYMPDAATTYQVSFNPASDYVEGTPPCGPGIIASTSDSNGPCNVVDNNLATRWSGNGDGAWLKLDLGSSRTIGHVGVAVYQGNLRRNRFDLQVSDDNVSWRTIFAGESSGTTTAEQMYDFVDVPARFIRYLGHGNAGSANPAMNSVTEISIFVLVGPTPTPTPTTRPTVAPTVSPPGEDCVELVPSPAFATASTNDGNVPANAIDNNLATRWSGNGDGSWLQVDLQTVRTVCYVKIAFYSGNTRRYRFDIQGATGAGVWTTFLFNAVSSGTTTGLETFEFVDTDARYVRYIGHGNDDPLKSSWNSVSEFKVFVKPLVVSPTPTPTATPVVLPPTPTPTPVPGGEITPPASGVTASTHDGNIPGNVVDNNLLTRWSGSGDGAWLRLDLGAAYTVSQVKVAVYNGHTRRNRFDLQVSTDGTGWSTAWSGESSGTTTAEEAYDLGGVSARFVRYLGHMSTVNTFNSVTEVSVFGAPCTICPTPPPPTPTPTPDSGGPTAAELVAKMSSCVQDSSGTFKTDTEAVRTIPVCRATGGYWWKADMDIDCDGVRTSQCNENTDPWFQPDTALHTSSGQPFNSATMPYVVIPQPNSTWSYSARGIALGAVFAVVYNGKVEYGVFADTGPTDIIGEASYAMAQRLGIDPDPHTGGSDGPVWYLVFPGSKVQPVESHADAVAKGQALARQFVNSN